MCCKSKNKHFTFTAFLKRVGKAQKYKKQSDIANVQLIFKAVFAQSQRGFRPNIR